MLAPAVRSTGGCPVNAATTPLGRTADSVVRFPEVDWVEAARMAAVMKGMRASQWPALAVVAVLALLSYGHAPQGLLYGVLAVALLAAVLRHLVVRGHEKTVRAGQIDDQLAYLHRQRWIWPLNALSWGLWPLVFHGRLPPESEVVCWMLTAGVGGVVIAWMSAQLRVTRIFLATFLLCLALVLALDVVVPPARTTPLLNGAWLAVLLGGYGLLLLRLSRRLNEFYTRSIDLTYHNARLIHSLQEQTRAAQEASRFKDRFLAGAAHDLKQPVNALGIYAEWLSAEPELVDELGPKILQSTQAINALFDSMFDLVKVEAGRFVVDLAPVDVGGMLAELAVQFGPMATQKGLALRVRPIEAQLRSDPILLRRIVGNLVANAIRYTARGGVLLAARRRGDAICIEVWDTGPGIAEREQSQIFDEFYKIRSSGTEEGFGLGLAIVRRLSDRLGCEVSLRSRPGRGTVFRVRVPLEPPPAALRN